MWRKVIFILFVVAVTFSVGVIAIAQTKWIKKKLEIALKEAARNNGFELAIGDLEGSLPLQWKLREISLTKKDEWQVDIQEIKVRVAFLPLIRKQLSVSYLKGVKVKVQGPEEIFFDGYVQGSFSIRGGKRVAFALRLIDETNDRHVQVTGKGKINALKGSLRGTIDSWNFDAKYLYSPENGLEITKSSIENPSQKLQATATLLQGHLLADFDMDNLIYGPLHVSSVKGHVSADRGSIWKGEAEIEGISNGTLLLLKTPFTLDDRLTLSDIDLQGPSFSAGGYLSLPTVSGNLNVQSDDLSKITPFFEAMPLEGRCGGCLQLIDGRAAINLQGYDLKWRKVHIGECQINAELADVANPKGKIEIDAGRVYFTRAYLSSFTMRARSEGNIWPVQLCLDGTWMHPFRLNVEGHYENHHVLFDKIEGLFFEQPLYLKKPMNLFFSDGNYSLDALALSVGSATVEGSMNKDATKLDLKLHADKLPLSWLSMFAPYLTLEGESTIDCNVSATSVEIQGSCRLDLERLQATKKGETSPPVHARGSVEANLNDATLQVHGNFEASEEQAMLAHLSLPISYRLNPFSLSIDPQRNLSGSLDIEGKLQEIFSFANTGSQEISGWAHGKLNLFGTLKNPQLQGTLDLEQASYENQHIGIAFRDIDAKLHADKDKFIIDEFTATDGKNGKMGMKGEIELDVQNHFPYHLTGKFEHFDAIGLGLVQANLTGPASLDGNWKEATLTGAFSVDSAKVAIPKSLPADLPDLPYTFKDEKHEAPPPPKFPFSFDILFDSADTIGFEGSGINSTWGGHLHLHGINRNLLASGTLRLAKGQFQILGKTFVLQQGELTFSDRPGQDGFLNLTGTLNIHEATITAQLRGPLSSPQLSFHSAPALTTNEIFSLLLFNKRVSEIKPVQAVQLAHTVLTFYGHTGWNPVSQIGSGLSSLGIDTFDIVPSEDGLMQSSITIGKHFYLVRNMLVTLTQSRDSRRFLVEVDLGRGLLFQAENQFGPSQSQQEGKFSLKWFKNY